MSDAVGASVTEPFNALEVPLAPGVTLVEASAGTGKTFAITRLVLRLLLERRVESLSRILVVTFTEKATQELVTRIRSVLRLAEQVWSDTPPPLSDTTADLFALRATHGPAGRQVVQDALAALDDLAVSTIHGFCQRILSESALESRIPFRTTFIEDDTEPFSRAARDWARRRVMLNDEAAGMVVAEGGNVDAWVKKVVSPYRRQPQTRVEHDPTDEAQALVADFVTSVDGAFELEKTRRHLLGFDDLLRKLSDALVGEGPDGPLARRIRTRFGAALIDEFQDTDQTQFPIFSNAFAGCPLFLIGDPKQSIYRFRGADIHAYLRAATAARRKYTLFQNFRSTAGYVLAVEQLFTRASDPFLVSEQDIPYPRVSAALAPPPPGAVATDGRGAMEWWWVDGSLGKKKTVSKDDAIRLVVRDVTNEIVRLQAGGVAYGSIAVLTRTNDEARLVKASLDRARVPAVIGGDADVLESEEAQELSRLAAAIAVPHDSRAVRSAMATRLWGSDAAEIAHTLDTNGAHEAAWAAITERFVRARELWRTRGVAAAFGELLAERRTAARLLALPDGERRLTNVRHVTELFHEGWATEGIAPEGFSAWVARERTVVNTPGRRELRLETDSDAVQVLTVHKAKGLQFDIVFCPMLWQSRGPDEGPLGVPVALVSDGATAVLDLGTSRIGERQSTARLEDRAENLRLAYVALTRAIHRCYVVWGEIGQKGAGDSALGHLLRTPDGTVSRETLADLVAQSGGVMTVRDVVADAPRAVAPHQGSHRQGGTARTAAGGRSAGELAHDLVQWADHGGSQRRGARRGRPPHAPRARRRADAGHRLPCLPRGAAGRHRAARHLRGARLPARRGRPHARPGAPNVRQVRARRRRIARRGAGGRCGRDAGDHLSRADPRRRLHACAGAAARDAARMALRPLGRHPIGASHCRRPGRARVAARPRLRPARAGAARLRGRGIPQRRRRPGLRARGAVVADGLEVEPARRGR